MGIRLPVFETLLAANEGGDKARLLVRPGEALMDKVAWVRQDMLVWAHWNKEVGNRLDELAWARLSQMVFDMMTEARVRKQDEVYSSRARLFLMFELEEEHI